MGPKMIFNVISLLINAAIVIFTLKALIGFFTVGGKGNMKVRDYSALKYFTVLSNILMALTALVMIVFNVMLLVNAQASAPGWAIALKHVGTVAVMLTFSVVFMIFVPSTGVKFMIEGDSLYMHLITPLIAAVGFMFFDPGPAVSWWFTAVSMIPMMLYAVLYYIMVMVKGPDKGGWEDFYKFNANNKWYLSAAGIFIMTAALGALLILGRNVFALGLLA